MNNMNLDYFMIILNDENGKLYPDYIWIISKKELVRIGKYDSNTSGDKYFCIAPPNYTRDKNHWSLSYWVRIDAIDNLIGHIESFPNSSFVDLIKLLSV